jgi:CRISPR system Cascade subunit CasA
MQPMFNLIDQPWIPCILPDGTQEELSLSQLFRQAGEVRELGGESPMVTASLYRLLLALLHRTQDGPKDIDDWHRLWQQGWDQQAFEDYFDVWYSRFDLFHPEKPFYQRADERMSPRSVTAMIHDAASGNNATLFDHHVDDDVVSLTPGEAARLLLVIQNYGLAGPCNPKLKLYFTGGPCVGGIVFLAQGENLQQTLLLNLLPYPDAAVMPIDGEDRMSWEVDDPLLPQRSIPLGYLDYLTWQNRRVLLLPKQMSDRTVVQEMTMSPALTLDAGVLDPMMHYRKDEQLGPRSLGFSESRALWRDSATLFQLRNDKYRPLAVLEWLAMLNSYHYLEDQHTYRLQAFGMVNDKAKMEFFRHERLPLPPEYLEDTELVEMLQNTLSMAQETANQLWGATASLAKRMVQSAEDKEPHKEDWRPLLDSWGVDRIYWAQLEAAFRLTMHHLPESPVDTLIDWRQTLYRAAKSAFDDVADNLGTSPRTLRAVVQAQEQLVSGLAKALPRQ